MYFKRTMIYRLSFIHIHDTYNEMARSGPLILPLNLGIAKKLYVHMYLKIIIYFKKLIYVLVHTEITRATP